MKEKHQPTKKLREEARSKVIHIVTFVDEKAIHHSSDKGDSMLNARNAIRFDTKQ